MKIQVTLEILCPEEGFQKLFDAKKLNAPPCFWLEIKSVQEHGSFWSNLNNGSYSQVSTMVYPGLALLSGWGGPVPQEHYKLHWSPSLSCRDVWGWQNAMEMADKVLPCVRSNTTGLQGAGGLDAQLPSVGSSLAAPQLMGRATWQLTLSQRRACKAITVFFFLLLVLLLLW